MADDTQLNLPLDERFRQAEQYTLDLGEVPHQGQKPPVTDFATDTCPYHRTFHYECRFCNPR